MPDDAAGSGSQADRPTRLFAALWLPPEIAAALSAHLDTCWDDLGGNASGGNALGGDVAPGQTAHSGPPMPAEQPAPRLRRTRTDTWHVTLAFLGTAPLARSIRRFYGSSQAISELSSCQSDGLPTAGSLQLAGAGSFGPAVWVGVSHDGWLADLAEVMQRRLSVRDRRFHAHVTVGRVRGPQYSAGAGATRGSNGPVTSGAESDGAHYKRSEATRTINNVIKSAVASLGDWRGPCWAPAEMVLVESVLGPQPKYPVRARLPLT